MKKEEKIEDASANSYMIPTLEAIQLCYENAQRLFEDSLEDISIPSQMALLELSLEEVSKTLALVFMFEHVSFKVDDKVFDNYLKVAHIKKERYLSKLEEVRNTDNKKENFQGLELTYNEVIEMFEKHKVKIKFISKLIKHVRDFMIPFSRGLMDREKTLKELIGRYYNVSSTEDLDAGSQFVKDALNIDENQLGDIIKERENALYVSWEKGLFTSPNLRANEPELIENLVLVLLGIAKTEVLIMTKAISRLE